MVAENTHRSSSPSYFSESSFNGISGSQGGWWQGDGDLQEGQQLWQIRLQALSGLGVEPLPSSNKALSRLLSLAEIFGVADALEVFFGGFLVGSFYIIEDVASFVGPAALEGHVGIDEGESSQETFSPIHDDQLEVFPQESPAVEVVEESFPVGLFFRGDLAEVDDFLFAIEADSQGYEDGAFLGTQAGLAFDDQAVEDEDLVVVGEFSSVVGLDRRIELLGDPADRRGADDFSENGQEGLSDLAGGEAEDEGQHDHAVNGP